MNFSAASSSLIGTQTNNIHNNKLQKARSSSSSSFSLNTTRHRQLHLHFQSSDVIPLRSSYTRSLSHSSMVLSIVSFFSFLFNDFEFQLIYSLLIFQTVKAVAQTEEPLRVMISGAPASGKGTQCQLITKKVSLFNSI